MSTLQKLNELKITAMKAKDKETLTSVREVLSAIQRKEKNIKGEMTEADVVKVLIEEVNATKDSIVEYGRAIGRNQEIEALKTRLALYMTFLPDQMTEDEIRALVARLIVEKNIQSKADQGKLWGALRPLVAGKADSTLVSVIVKELLS